MVRVVRHPSLQAAERSAAHDATAVEKLAVDAADLGDVRVVGDASAIGQNKGHRFFAEGGEQGGEFGSIHGRVGGFCGMIRSQERSRSPISSRTRRNTASWSASDPVVADGSSKGQCRTSPRAG